MPASPPPSAPALRRRAQQYAATESDPVKFDEVYKVYEVQEENAYAWYEEGTYAARRKAQASTELADLLKQLLTQP